MTWSILNNFFSEKKNQQQQQTNKQTATEKKTDLLIKCDKWYSNSALTAERGMKITYLTSTLKREWFML